MFMISDSTDSQDQLAVLDGQEHVAHLNTFHFAFARLERSGLSIARQIDVYRSDLHGGDLHSTVSIRAFEIGTF